MRCRCSRASTCAPSRRCRTGWPPPAAPPVVLHVFALEAGAAPGGARFHALLGALGALLDGAAEADGFNRLVLRAGLDWRECWLLRAMFRWLKQVGFRFAQASVEAALAAHPAAARAAGATSSTAASTPASPATARRRRRRWPRWTVLLEAVENPDEDRILTRLRTAAGRHAAHQLLPGARPPGLQDRQRRGRRDARAAPLARDLRAFRRAWRAATCAPGPSRAAASAGPTGGRISAPRSWA